MKKLCFLLLLCSSVAMFTACEDGEDDSVNTLRYELLSGRVGPVMELVREEYLQIHTHWWEDPQQQSWQLESPISFASRKAALKSISWPKLNNTPIFSIFTFSFLIMI